MVWYSHLLQNFPQFLVIHTVEGFGVVSKAEIDVFLELSCFFDAPADIGNLISGSSALNGMPHKNEILKIDTKDHLLPNRGNGLRIHLS